MCVIFNTLELHNQQRGHNAGHTLIAVVNFTESCPVETFINNNDNNNNNVSQVVKQ